MTKNTNPCVKIGRPATTLRDVPSLFIFYVQKMHEEDEWNISKCARIIGVSRPTVYKYLRIMRDSGKFRWMF